MADIRTFDDLFPLDETLCRECSFRMSRSLLPLDLDSFGLDDVTLKEIGIDATDEEVIVEQHICLISQQEMDYLVKTCTHFKHINRLTIFKSNILDE